MPPFFSIVVPTYNRALLVKDTVQSMLAQSFTDLEIIVVDDGGTDSTKETLSAFNDERLKYFWKENGERGAARNYGLSKASGQYICFFDSDDFMRPDHLEKVHRFLTEQAFPEIVFTAFSIQENGQVHKNELNAGHMEKENLCYNNVFPPLACFIKNENLEPDLFSNDHRFVFIEELYAWLKLTKQKTPVFFDTDGAVLIAHTENSMNAPDPEKFAYSLKKIIELVNNEQLLTRRQAKLLHSSQITMYALILVQHKKRIKALGQLVKAFFTDFRMLKLKRTYAVIYKSIQCW